MPATINLGDIVALKGHPYYENVQSIVISGDSHLVPPMMVVIEIIRETKDQYDEKTGEVISKSGASSCKCIWYSNKSHQFEEAWISSKLLKRISEASKDNLGKQNLITQSKDFRGVTLKTQDLETGKYRSSLVKEDSPKDGVGEPKSTITSLQSFVSPIMEIIQIIDPKPSERENQFDSKTGRQRRFCSSFSVKCKWFNPNGDKLSEKVIPVEALMTVRRVSETHMQFLNDLIKDKDGFFSTSHVGSGSINITFVRPLQIFFRNGKYILVGYDYSLNKKREFPLPLKDYHIETTYRLSESPLFDFLKKGKTSLTKKKSRSSLPETISDELRACIQTARVTNQVIRLKYLGQMDKITYKTIYDYSILPVVINATRTKDEVFYLEGKNVADDSERTFRSDRILKIQVLPIRF